MWPFSRYSRGDAPKTVDDASDRPWFKRSHVVMSALAALAMFLMFAGWLGYQAYSAKTNLEQARTSAEQAKDALLDGDTGDASRFAAETQQHAQAARDATHSLPWEISSAVPFLGSPFKTTQQISDVVLGLASDVLKPTADAGVDVAPDELFANGQLDVKALRDQEPVLATIAAEAERLNSDADAISDPRYLPMVGEARLQLQAQTADLASLMTNTALAARVAPPLMGADGPRSYFMGFQTNAEARGTGGLLGGFGVLDFNDGKPSVQKLGPNTLLFDQIDSFVPISLGPEFDESYGFTNPTTDIRNSNQSSHFPYAAQIWKSMWAQQSGDNVDGVIAIDPIALSYILAATGPVTMPDGEVVTDKNVVELTESTVYKRFPLDQKERKQYLQDVATSVVRKFEEPLNSPRKLLDALGRGVSERRIMMWSSSPAEQELLEETPLAHIIPADRAPYAEVVVNNLGGNKIDYYLNREIEYAADDCKTDTRSSTVTVRLTNTVSDPDSLPEYVAGRMGFFPDIAADIPKGTMISSVRLLTTADTRLGSVLVNGDRVKAFQTTERGHPSYEIQVAIPAGKSSEITFRLSEPTSPGEARVPIQPLVDAVNPVVSVPECSP